MKPDEIAAVVDGVRVVVDLSGFRLHHHASWLIVSAVLSIVTFVACVIVVASERRRRLGLAAVTGAIGGAVALSLAPVVLGVYGRWMPDLGLRVSQGTLLVGLAGAGVGALLLAIPVVFISSVRPRSSWVVCGVGVVAVVVGIVAVVRAQNERRDVVTALADTIPIPRFAFAGQAPGEPLPEVHVGRRRVLAPERVWRLETSGAVFTSAASALPAPTDRWHLQHAVATLTATRAGEHEATVVAREGPVRVEQQVRFVAVDASAPAAFPLTPGKRFAWSRVSGPRGIVEHTETFLAKGKKKPKPPKTDITAVVLDERIEDGFRIARVQVGIDGVTNTIDVVARNGSLVRRQGGPFLTVEGEGMCNAAFVGFDSCRCTAAGITRCATFDSDNLGAFMRIGLAVATMGISEVMGACKTCGTGHEEGLLLLP